MYALQISSVTISLFLLHLGIFVCLDLFDLLFVEELLICLLHELLHLGCFYHVSYHLLLKGFKCILIIGVKGWCTSSPRRSIRQRVNWHFIVGRAKAINRQCLLYSMYVSVASGTIHIIRISLLLFSLFFSRRNLEKIVFLLVILNENILVYFLNMNFGVSSLLINWVLWLIGYYTGRH